MRCIVQKYGGSSVADIDKIKKVAELIANVKRQGIDVAVVVSAMGKTTDGLIEMARSISKNPPRREMDMLLSTGERITMSLLCIALHEIGVEAVSLTGSQSGIITNHRHNDARVIEVRPFRVQDEMAEGKVVVVGGFQGVSYKREITTLGRGGSDTTAVALAAALNAERCEIYSDIDGVYTADPAIVAEAKHLPEISYQVMQEMASAGAKVLNAQAVEFAKQAQIAIYARSTFNPGRETVIRKLPSGIPHGVKAVVSEHDVVRVRIHGSKTLEHFDWIMRYLEENQVAVKELNVSGVESESSWSRASFVISQKNIYGWDSMKRTIEEKCGCDVEFEGGLAALSLIGEGLNRDNEALLRTIQLLRKIGVNVVGVATTSFRISLLVPKEKIVDCVRACHREWIEKNVQEIS